MLCYPYLFHTICNSSEQAGMCLGVAIHDTSQVLGGSMTYAQVYGDEVALKVAAITKLSRNLLLAGVIPGFTMLHHQQGGGGGEGGEGGGGWQRGGAVYCISVRASEWAASERSE